MVDVRPWPSVLVPSSEEWSLRGGTRSGGQTFQGNEQLVASPTARWKASLTIPCVRREQVFAMRQVIALGRSAVWGPGPIETNRAPWNVDFIGSKITYGQGAKNAAIDPAYEAGGDMSSALVFSLADAAPRNAPLMTVQRDKGGVLEVGMLMQFGDYRMHVITGLPGGELAVPGKQGPPGRVLVEIRPWLRADYAAGTRIEFGTPHCAMRLASDDTAAMELQLSKYGTVTLDLVEAF